MYLSEVSSGTTAPEWQPIYMDLSLLDNGDPGLQIMLRVIRQTSTLCIHPPNCTHPHSSIFKLSMCGLSPNWTCILNSRLT